MTDSRTRFGVPLRPPDRHTAVGQYLNRSAHKLHVAEYHIGEFERLEDGLTWNDFVDFEGEPFVAAQAHADAALIQVAAAFDAFACAVAHRYGVKNPDRADFAGWAKSLAAAADEDVRVAIESVAAEKDFTDLQLYRNLAAHRGVLGEQQRGDQDEHGAEQVHLLLPGWLPEDFPDFPGAAVRSVLRRYVDWARPQIERLQAAASLAWTDDGEPTGELIEDVAPAPTTKPDTDAGDDDLSAYALPTPEQEAPTFGGWRAWYSSGSHDFISGITDLPAWFLRSEDGGAVVRLDSVELTVDGLREWLVGVAGADVAKAVLRYYQPRQMHETTHGTILIPALTRRV